MGVSAAIAGFRLDRGSVLGDSDEYLVARLRAGDDAAFEAIYDRYARGLLAFCVHMLGSREAAEDALQLTFVSAFRALRRGESNIVLRPWLYTIARNRCLSELRTRCDFVDVDGVVVDRPFLEGVVDQVERREDLREMLQDMKRLPADQRAALVLFELGDHSHEEIAAVLGVRKEKVKALVFQAREALMRGRRARERPCAEIRERLATLQGTVLARSMARAHIDRCPSCAAFESEVRRQHAALALLLPVALTSQLKASVLGSALRSGYALAATGGTAAGGAGGAGALAAGGATAAGGAGGAGALAAGGATAAGGAGGAGALAAGGVTAAGGAGAAAAGSVAAATGAASTAVIAGAPSVAAVATGLTAVGADYAASVGVGGLGATGVLAKILTAAAIATAGAGAIHDSTHGGHPLPSPLAVLVAPATPSNPAAALTIALTPATPLSSAPTAGAPTDTTTTAPATAPGTTATTTATALAAAPSTGPTDTAAASVPAATTTTTPAAASSTGTTGTSAPSAPAATTTTTPAAASSTGTTGTSAPSAPAATTTTTPAAASSTGTTGTSAPSAPATTTTTTPVAAPSTTTTATSPPASSTDSTGTVAPSAPATTTTTSPSATPNTDSTDIAPSVAQ
jgi:RNA polymerase sigma factor (sigma-70 family)